MWHIDEVELRSFLVTSAEGMTAWFKTQEEDARSRAQAEFDPQYSREDDGYSFFMDRVGIFWEQYWYQLAAAVIKDACTLYEVFLEESAHETLQRYGSGLTTLSTEDSWRPNECHEFYRNYFDIRIDTADVEHIRWIRNKLSHLRDSLRTNAGEAEFSEKLKALGIDAEATSDELELNLPHHEYGRELSFGDSLTLSPLEAWRILNILRSHIEHVTRVLHDLQFGKYTTQALFDLTNGKVVRDRDKRILLIPTPGDE